MSSLLFVLSCMGSIALGFIGVVSLFGWESRRSEVAAQLRSAALSPSLRSGQPTYLDAWSRRIEGTAWAKSARLQLAQADLEITPAQFAAILAGVWFVFFLAIWMFFQPPLPIVVLLATALVWLAQRFILQLRKDHYLTLLANQMPDVAILVSNSLKAGLSVTQAFHTVAEKTPRPASVEFAKLVRQISLGAPFDEAIQSMMERLPCEELSLLLTTVAIQRKAGGNLSRALSVMSVAIAARHRVRNEISTLTAEARYTGVIIMILPVIIMAMLNQTMDGAVSAFLNHPVGWVVMPLFIGVQVIAFVAINRIANVKV